MEQKHLTARDHILSPSAFKLVNATYNFYNKFCSGTKQQQQKKSARTQRHRQTAPINGLCALKLMALIKFAATGRNDNTFGRYATITLAK